MTDAIDLRDRAAVTPAVIRCIATLMETQEDVPIEEVGIDEAASMEEIGLAADGGVGVLVMETELTLGIRLPDDVEGDIGTVSDLIDAVVKAAGGPRG